jgi:hypothetical protein
MFEQTKKSFQLLKYIRCFSLLKLNYKIMRNFITVILAFSCCCAAAQSTSISGASASYTLVLTLYSSTAGMFKLPIVSP